MWNQCRKILSKYYHGIRIPLLRLFRRMTSDYRAQPDFFIIGVQKGGTTSLFHYLSAHPQVGSILRKEPFYYLWNFNRGLNWYRSNFPFKSEIEAKSRRAGQKCLVYEASTHYIFYPQAARRILKDCPAARFILVLRDPVERAFSHWRHRRRRGEESRDFEECIAHELSAGGSRVIMQARLKEEQIEWEWCERQYLSHGLYLEQIEAWLEVIDRDRLMILISEDFFEDPKLGVRKVETFLGIEHNVPEGGFPVYNQGRPGQMNEDIRAQLVEFYKTSNSCLEKFLGRALPWS